MTSVDFQQRLRDLVNLSIRTYTGQTAGFEERDFLIAALTRSHATLLVERDAARAETSTLQNELANAEEAIRRMIRALQFYGDNWRGNMIGGGEQHNTYCFQEPTDELMQDAGSIARAALAASP